MKTYNIMELVEGKKYKDHQGREWSVDDHGYVESAETDEDITELYDSCDIRRLVFTEVKEPITITLEAEELEFIKNLLDGTCIIPYDSGMKIGEKLLEKLNGVAFETYELK